MTGATEIRPMRAADVPATFGLTMRAFEMAVPSDPDERERHERRHRIRCEHLLETDPQGAWVAEERDGRLSGVAMSLVRDRRLWALSLLVVEPDRQSHGTGGALLERALGHGGEAPVGMLMASTDSRALRIYARAGFTLHPTVSAAGTVDRAALPAIGGQVAEAAEEWLDAAAAISRELRGASHSSDVAALLRAGDRLLHLDDRGFVLHDRGCVRLLAARDETAAQMLLWSALAEADGSVAAEVNWMTGDQDWAVRIAVDAGLALRVTGPLCVRGAAGPLRPYLPSGSYL